MSKIKEASDPKTKPERLVVLSKSRDYEVRKSLAKNPSTPLQTLFVLWQTCKNQSLKNPLLPTLLKKRPHFLKRAPSSSMFALLSLQKTPGWVFEGALVHSNVEVRLAATKDPELPAKYITAFASDKAWRVRRSIAQHPKTTRPVLTLLAKDKEPHVRLAVANHPDVSSAILRLLAKDTSSAVRCRVASHKKTPHLSLRSLLNDKVKEVRYLIAQNPATPLSLLEILAKQKSADVRWRVPTNPNVSKALLGILSTDKDSKVRKAALRAKRWR